MTLSDRCLLLQLGRVEYGDAFRFQQAVAALREVGALPDTVILLEHPPVLTLGRRANRANILAPDEWLAREGVTVHQSTRGGDVTYHGPGQVVGYPIVDLRARKLGIAAYVHGLEKVIIETLAHWDIEAQLDSHYIGVWTGDRKIAAIGVAVSRGITLHGFALNVCPKLAHFGLINPCGITERGVTSMAELLGLPPPLEQVKAALVEGFSRVFGIEPAPPRPGELEAIGLSLPPSVG